MRITSLKLQIHEINKQQSISILEIPISLDTRKSWIMERAINYKVDLINDDKIDNTEN